MPYYKTGEILERAIDMERKGAAFYEALAGKFSDGEMKQTFEMLASEEREHEDLFNKLLEKHGDFRTEFGWDFEDYLGGLQMLSDEGIFEEDRQTVKKAVLAQEPAELIVIALQFERDSILYYNEMRPFVEGDAMEMVEELIDQEREHVRRLNKVLLEMTG